MLLSTLIKDLYPPEPSLAIELQGLAQNSQHVEPGYLYMASMDKYIDEALSKGAIAVLREGDQAALEWRQNKLILSVPGLSQKMTELAERFYDYPAKKLSLVGVTGTNGKTSCSQFVAQALQAFQTRCGVIGTLGCGFLDNLKDISMTTPDPASLQKTLADLVKQGATHVVMEVSSHGLDQERIRGLSFEVGMFTNLTQDHLDYHGSMAAYGAAKRRFFTDYPMGKAVINADDAFGQELIQALPAEKVLTYSAKGMADIAAHQLSFDLSGVRAAVQTPWGKGELFAPLIGEFNLSNVLAVLATLGALGLPLADILKHLASLQPVPGRMQSFGGGPRPWVIVDYAHTPDALEKTLKALRKHCEGRLSCLFGCGGDRDKGKRPLMGEIAEKYADFVMLTDDNPRHEASESIIEEILKGVQEPAKVVVQANRSKAIQDIIQCAKAGDYILIAGKGAETYQQIGDERFPFSDGQKISEIFGD